jgi:hypothetical protein
MRIEQKIIMWNKKPVPDFQSIPWLTEMKLTEEGRENLTGEKLEKRKAVFVGFTKDGNFYKILLEGSSTPYVYSRNFWEEWRR